MPHSQYNRAILIVQCVTLTKVKRLKGCLEVVQPFYAEHSPEPSNVIVECVSFNVYTLYRDDDSHVLSMCKLHNTRPVIQSLTASAISHLILLMQLNSRSHPASPQHPAQHRLRCLYNCRVHHHQSPEPLPAGPPHLHPLGSTKQSPGLTVPLSLLAPAHWLSQIC